MDTTTTTTHNPVVTTSLFDAFRAILGVDIPEGYKLVTTDMQEGTLKPNEDVLFWSTKTHKDGAFMRIKDKEDRSWHKGCIYIIPEDLELEPIEPPLSISVLVNGTEIELPSELAEAIKAQLG